MKSDLDLLMEVRAIDAIVVSMHEATHPAFQWLTRGAKLTKGYVIKKRGEEPLLIHYPMEREEAAATGVATRSVHDFDHTTIFRTYPNPAAAYAEFFSRVFREMGVEGKIAFNGNLPVHLYFELIENLEKQGWVIYRGGGEDLVQLARKRKEAWELEHVASVGRRTEAVVERVREVLRTAKIVDGIAQIDGRVMTLGDLKTLVTTEIVRQGMIEDHETILSQGRDAGIPHSRGDAAAPVRASQPIILDIFPADRESGYFFDLTRTFCIGEIPEKLKKIHADVLAAFELSREQMTAGTEAKTYQALVCDYFEKRGYATLRSDAKTESGYVHSLGHGVGLQVHEKPFFALSPTNEDLIEIGDVLTIEPGLYFPDDEIGVRIEDTLFIDESGRAVTFCSSNRGLEP